MPLEEKIALCLAAEEALVAPGIEITSSFVRALRETRAFASSEGADTVQTLCECGAGIDALARSDDGRIQTRSYPSGHGGSSAQAGWEYVESLELAGAAPRVAEEALALLRADPCPAGVTTLVLDSEQAGCRSTSRSAIRSSSTGSTAPRRPTRARAGSAPTRPARFATARSS